MAKLSRENSAGTLHPRENLIVSGILASLNSEIILTVDGVSTAAVDVRGTFVGTMTVEGSFDGINWVLFPLRSATFAGAYAVAVSTTGAWVGASPAFELIRVRMTAYTSGSAVVTLLGSNGLLDQTLNGAVTPLIGTIVGAASAAVTLTLPAAPAGLRQYITYLSINRFASAALTAGAAPVTVTTNGLPGSLAFSFAADAAAAGTLDRWREDFAFPLAAQAQGGTCAIVCPAITGVIWRATAGYYLAP